jgi:hypothetical protein
MTTLNSTPAVEALLAMIGVTSEEELFTKNAVAGLETLGTVNMQMWRALDDYRSAEKEFRDQVQKTSDEALRQMGSLDKGCTPDASWFTNYAGHAADAQAKMTEAVNTLHALVAIRNTLVVK